MNNNIKEYLDDYIESNPTGFSVMVTGDWGSGKTFFIKEYIKDRKKKEGGKELSKKTIYISLFGLSSISDINYKFLESLCENFSTHKGKKFSKAFCAGTKLLMFLKLPYGISSVVKTVSDLMPQFATKINNTDTIVFDDLERCNMKSSEMFGYINDLLEIKKKRVILIANEEKINDVPAKKEKGDKKKYEEVKEKTVGRTFSLVPDLHSALDFFIKDIFSNDSDKNMRCFVKENKERILDIYKKIKYNNLRHLRFFLIEFKFICAILPAGARGNAGFMDEFIESLMILLFETREGFIKIEDVKDMTQKIKTERHHQENVPKNKNIKEFHEKYCDNSESSNRSHLGGRIYRLEGLFLGDDFWYSFLNKRVIDKKELEKSIDNSKYFFKESSPEEWVNLWYFRRLNEEAFIKIFDGVKKNFQENKYTQPEVILHIAGMLLFFSRKKIKGDSIKTTEEHIKNKIDEITDSNQLGRFEKNITLGSGSSHGLGFYELGSAEFSRIVEHLSSNIVKVQDKIMENNLKSIHQGNLKDVVELLEQNPENGKKYSSKILLGIKPVKVADGIIELRPEDALNCCDEISGWLGYIYANGFYPDISKDGNDSTSQDRMINNLNQENKKQNEWIASVGDELNEKKSGLSEFRKYQIDCYKAHLGIKVKEN